MPHPTLTVRKDPVLAAMLEELEQLAGDRADQSALTRLAISRLRRDAARARRKGGDALARLFAPLASRRRAPGLLEDTAADAG